MSNSDSNWSSTGLKSMNVTGDDASMSSSELSSSTGAGKRGQTASRQKRNKRKGVAKKAVTKRAVAKDKKKKPEGVGKKAGAGDADTATGVDSEGQTITATSTVQNAEAIVEYIEMVAKSEKLPKLVQNKVQTAKEKIRAFNNEPAVVVVTGAAGIGKSFRCNLLVAPAVTVAASMFPDQTLDELSDEDRQRVMENVGTLPLPSAASNRPITELVTHLVFGNEFAIRVVKTSLDEHEEVIEETAAEGGLLAMPDLVRRAFNTHGNHLASSQRRANEGDLRVEVVGPWATGPRVVLIDLPGNHSETVDTMGHRAILKADVVVLATGTSRVAAPELVAKIVKVRTQSGMTTAAPVLTNVYTPENNKDDAEDPSAILRSNILTCAISVDAETSTAGSTSSVATAASEGPTIASTGDHSGNQYVFLNSLAHKAKAVDSSKLFSRYPTQQDRVEYAATVDAAQKWLTETIDQAIAHRVYYATMPVHQAVQAARRPKIPNNIKDIRERVMTRTGKRKAVKRKRDSDRNELRDDAARTTEAIIKDKPLEPDYSKQVLETFLGRNTKEDDEVAAFVDKYVEAAKKPPRASHPINVSNIKSVFDKIMDVTGSVLINKLNMIQAEATKEVKKARSEAGLAFVDAENTSSIMPTVHVNKISLDVRTTWSKQVSEGIISMLRTELTNFTSGSDPDVSLAARARLTDRLYANIANIIKEPLQCYHDLVQTIVDTMVDALEEFMPQEASEDKRSPAMIGLDKRMKEINKHLQEWRKKIEAGNDPSATFIDLIHASASPPIIFEKLTGELSNVSMDRESLFNEPSIDLCLKLTNAPPTDVRHSPILQLNITQSSHSARVTLTLDAAIGGSPLVAEEFARLCKQHVAKTLTERGPMIASPIALSLPHEAPATAADAQAIYTDKLKSQQSWLARVLSEDEAEISRFVFVGPTLTWVQGFVDFLDAQGMQNVVDTAFFIVADAASASYMEAALVSAWLSLGSSILADLVRNNSTFPPAPHTIKATPSLDEAKSCYAPVVDLNTARFSEYRPLSLQWTKATVVRAVKYISTAATVNLHRRRARTTRIIHSSADSILKSSCPRDVLNTVVAATRDSDTQQTLDELAKVLEFVKSRAAEDPSLTPIAASINDVLGRALPSVIGLGHAKFVKSVLIRQYPYLSISKKSEYKPVQGLIMFRADKALRYIPRRQALPTDPNKDIHELRRTSYAMLNKNMLLDKDAWGISLLVWSAFATTRVPPNAPAASPRKRPHKRKAASTKSSSPVPKKRQKMRLPSAEPELTDVGSSSHPIVLDDWDQDVAAASAPTTHPRAPGASSGTTTTVIRRRRRRRKGNRVSKKTTKK
ncbi:uncharacterized protein AMSG_03532 [Thecamonas trahens ATCC 50062]|uniref:Uncharacterized protein n=1 Tax=Thecamonas trahens ATCC 50062 TaxID=461836 RepID=A0A0L0D744_THETB|nr:hypothetical protein AMSG_03532 [Thecamonas trahens ATCC 50062]KNC47103.1 hypothetical protein AMSG_03532 [Thecamonas trahens ATCC 50062]|eukprot:XP_013759880.1 hypothetical protein AMSG_03532 [Thecamonas trahens ATCC 50062]